MSACACDIRHPSLPDPSFGSSSFFLFSIFFCFDLFCSFIGLIIFFYGRIKRLRHIRSAPFRIGRQRRPGAYVYLLENRMGYSTGN